jgi:regulator of sigma E protease
MLEVLLHNIVSFLIIISIIVFIHEFGHFWFARRFGVKVEAFSIGFGREVFGFNDSKGTRWKFGWLPLGGYVKMFGDEGAASTPDNNALKKLTKAERKIAFATQPLIARFLIVLGGPLANFILAIIILTGFFYAYGKPFTSNVVTKVIEQSAAAEIGLKAGDKIIEIDGEKVDSFDQIRSVVSIHPEQALPIKFEREGKIIIEKITPKLQETENVFGEKVKVGLIGVQSEQLEYVKVGLPAAFVTSFEETYTMCVRTLQAVGQMITGNRSSSELSGILRIAEYSGKSVDQGFRMILWFMAILSINLGLINLFPVPMLDGGHLAMYIVEGVRGKPLSEKVQEYLFRIGFAILIALMVFATFNDLKHFKFFGLLG